MPAIQKAQAKEIKQTEKLLVAWLNSEGLGIFSLEHSVLENEWTLVAENLNGLLRVPLHVCHLDSRLSLPS